VDALVVVTAFAVKLPADPSDGWMLTSHACPAGRPVRLYHPLELVVVEPPIGGPLYGMVGQT
jgi:hypothetical protein